MGSLERRIRALEAGGAQCPECGFDGDWSNAEIVVEWADLDSHVDEEPEEPEFCGTCGHQLVWVVTWDDLEESKWRA